MAREITCPECNQSNSVSAACKIGQSLTCDHCRQMFFVPQTHRSLGVSVAEAKAMDDITDGGEDNPAQYAS